MKTIFFILGIVGLAGINSYAQTEKCVCVKKTAHHYTHRKKATHTVASAKKNDQHEYSINYSRSFLVNSVPANSCIIDTNGDIEYTNSSTYLGYYPASDVTCDLDVLLVPRYKDLLVTSSAFANNGVLPAKYTCQGEQVSPPLSITNIPPGTASVAIVMFDPHATSKMSTTYWLMWDLDATGVVPENFVTDHESENPVNKQYGYQGACPAAGTHYYHFRVYALDTKLLLDKHATKATLERAMRGHVLAKGELTGLSDRHLE